MPEYDVVIGYHDDDDLPFREVRWVSKFCSYLEMRIRMVGVDPPAEIWTFGQLRGNQKVRQTQASAVQNARTMVAVISNLYTGPSPEYRGHWQSLERALGEEFSTRLFRAFKARPECEASSGFDTRGYTFYREIGPGRHQEFSPDSDEFDKSMTELAYDIKDTLATLRKLPSIPAVFLAAAPPSLGRERETLREWLRGQRLRVLPEASLTIINRQDYVEQIDDLIRSCQLSIHLLTSDEGPPLPELEGQTRVAVDYDRIRPRLASGHLAAIAWAPADSFNRQSVSDSSVISNLIRSASEGVDILCPDLIQNLHTQILKRLGQPVDPVARESKKVYLIRHPADTQQTGKLAADLSASGYQVSTPLVDFKSSSFSSEHQTNLRNAHAAVLCGGRGPREWLPYVQQITLEHLQTDLNFSDRRVALYMGPDHEVWKDEATEKAPFPTKIVDYGGFNKASLDHFLVQSFSGPEGPA